MENQLQLVNQASLRFLEPVNPEELYKIIIDEGKKLVGAQFGTIFLQHKGKLTRVYASDTFLYKIKPRPKGYTHSVFKSNKILVNTYESYVKVHPTIAEHGIKQAFLIPLSYQSKSIGVLVLHRITERNYTEQDINIMQLFGSLASLAIKKTQLYDETKKALELRDLFISTASHELRTPLTSISGYIQLLHRKLGNSKSLEGKWIQELHTESKRLIHLVTELLVVNRMKAGLLQYSWDSCNLREIIQKAENNFRFSFSERAVEIHDSIKDQTGLIIGDEDKLLQALNNLLENAVKFSQKQSTISLTLKSQFNNYLIEITDEGLGIPKADISKISNGFAKAGNNFGNGIGLGLFLVSNIIETHHGKIKIKSKVNKGTTVQVFLPKARL